MIPLMLKGDSRVGSRITEDCHCSPYHVDGDLKCDGPIMKARFIDGKIFPMIDSPSVGD